MEIQPGVYTHYKTRDQDVYYYVLFTTRDEATEETLVHYIPLYVIKDEVGRVITKPTTRTLENFTEIVKHSDTGGGTVRRFERVRDQ